MSEAGAVPSVQCAKCRACRGVVYDWKTNGHKRCPDCAAREAGAASYVVHYSDLSTDPVDGSVHTSCGLDRQPDAAGFRATNERAKATCKRCVAALNRGLS